LQDVVKGKHAGSPVVACGRRQDCLLDHECGAPIPAHTIDHSGKGENEEHSNARSHRHGESSNRARDRKREQEPPPPKAIRRQRRY
jgi:hypothetical protein